jgi:hypothetical protein
VDSAADFEELTDRIPTSDHVVGAKKVFPLQAEWYAFRSPQGHAELVAATRLPILPIPPRDDPRQGMRDPHPVHLIALDRDWREIARTTSEIPAYRLNYSAGTVWVPPPLAVEHPEASGRARHASLELISSFSDTAFTYRQDVPNVTGPGLQMSSLVLAANVAPAEYAAYWPEYSCISRPGSMVTPLPMRDFEIGQPLSLYFEVYSLEKDEVNATSYRVIYSVTSLRDGKVLPVLEFLGRLLGRDEQEGTVRLETHRDGIRSDVEETVRIIFPDDLDDNRYRIVVTVEDLISGQTTEREIVIRRR